MADSLNIVELNGTWESVSSLTNNVITAGMACSIQNQTSTRVYVAISATQPPSSFRADLLPIDLASKYYITAGENEIWLKGAGPISIQVG